MALEIAGVRPQKRKAFAGRIVARVRAARWPCVVPEAWNGARPDQAPRTEAVSSKIVQFSEARLRHL